MGEASPTRVASGLRALGRAGRAATARDCSPCSRPLRGRRPYHRPSSVRTAGGTSMDREEATVIANDAREQRGLSWANLAEVAGRSKVWTTSALLGQQAMPTDVAQKVGAALGLDEEVVAALRTSPSKGCLGDMIPTDPLMYRFYEILQVRSEEHTSELQSQSNL